MCGVLDQKRVFGVLYLITFVTSILALALYEVVLRRPVSYIAGPGHDTQVLFAALLELFLIIANIGTAVVIVPIMRRRYEDLVIGRQYNAQRGLTNAHGRRDRPHPAKR